MQKIKLQVLTTPGCHNCAAFKAYWESEQKNWKHVEYAEVSMLEPEGQKLVQEHKIFASPGIILNETLFSTGPVEQEQLIRELTKLSEVS